MAIKTISKIRIIISPLPSMFFLSFSSLLPVTRKKPGILSRGIYRKLSKSILSSIIDSFIIDFLNSRARGGGWFPKVQYLYFQDFDPTPVLGHSEGATVGTAPPRPLDLTARQGWGQGFI